MKVIVTDAHYRMSIAAIRDLGEAGYSVYAIHYGTGALPPALKSKYLAGCLHVTNTALDKRAEETIKAVDQIRDPEESIVLLPIGAATTAALASADISAHGWLKVIIPTDTQLANANDKYFVLQVARRLGIAVPDAYETPEEAEERLPVVIKYRNGEALGLKAEERYRRVGTHRELYDIYPNMASRAILGGQDVPLIQEYIDGEGIGVSCMLDRQSRPVSVICHRRIREYPISGGPSSCCETIWNEQLADDALRLLKELHWTGIAMVEFRGSEQKGYRLMEINPRIWGSFPLTRTAKTGFTDAYVRAVAGECLPEYLQPSYKIGKKMNFVFQDLAAGLSWLKKGNSDRLFEALIDIIDPRVRDGVFEFTDLGASLEYIFSMLRRLGGRGQGGH